MQQNIILIGMMGSGKTTIGRAVAQRINYPFFDSDHVIEERCGTSIATIFSLEGEIGFRKRETEVIHSLCSQANIVLATGGGAVLDEKNRKALQSSGIIIYLKASIDALWQRTSQDKTRPLLENKNPRQILENIYQDRDPIYTSMANYTVDTSKSNISTLITQILNFTKTATTKIED
ncbi:MAG: hypothetical protein RLZZ210_1045 [Pseudomonadota bacterium]|jgi:shikimate kinase